jgi:hypothetical protein
MEGSRVSSLLVLNIVPNGEVCIVANQTREWSRALVEVGAGDVWYSPVGGGRYAARNARPQGG